MKNYKTVSKSMLSVLLSVVMLLTCFSSAFAATIIDEEQKLQYLYTFNDGVNAIKEKKPSFKYTKSSGLCKEDYADIDTNLKVASDISDEARKYLSILVDSMFDPSKGLINNLFAVLTETDTSVTEKTISKGLDTTNFLPKYGETYVSGLTVADDYTLRAEEQTDILNPENSALRIRYDFQDCNLDTVKGSSLEKIFDLPSGAINPVVIGGPTYDTNDDPLDDVQFNDFKYHNAWVMAEFDGTGNLRKYTQNISYSCAISFYDMMRVFDVYTSLDLMAIGLAIANPILQNTGNPTVTAREVLQNTEMLIQYDVKIELTNFDWNPRYFGDIDNDGDVDAYDARSALRHSVSLDTIENQEALIYGDVDFNGVINASDARTILRTAVALEDEFSEVPEGESIKIVVLVPPEEPEKPENPEVPENPEEPENPDGEDEKPDVSDQVSAGITELVNTIFDVINGVKGDGITNTGIQGLIQSIKDIVNAGTSDNNPSGGIIIVDGQENS